MPHEIYLVLLAILGYIYIYINTSCAACGVLFQARWLEQSSGILFPDLAIGAKFRHLVYIKEWSWDEVSNRMPEKSERS